MLKNKISIIIIHIYLTSPAHILRMIGPKILDTCIIHILDKYLRTQRHVIVGSIGCKKLHICAGFIAVFQHNTILVAFVVPVFYQLGNIKLYTFTNLICENITICNLAVISRHRVPCYIITIRLLAIPTLEDFPAINSMLSPKLSLGYFEQIRVSAIL